MSDSTRLLGEVLGLYIPIETQNKKETQLFLNIYVDTEKALYYLHYYYYTYTFL